MKRETEAGRKKDAEASISVRPMTESDVETVVRLHQAAFADSYMTTFGERFLSAFYQALITHPAGVGWVAADGSDRPVGFCVGGSDDARSIARDMLRRRPFSFLWPALLNVLRSPRRLARLLQLARNYFGPRVDAGEVPSTALLMQIAVAESLRGSGAAERMVEAFLGEMRDRGVGTVSLGVEAENARAIAFYRRLGFREARPGIFECRLDSERGG